MLVNNIQHRTTFISTEFDIKNTDIKRCFGDRKKFNCRKPDLKTFITYLK